jgi:outer membrane beta-barrel protein
VCSPRACVAALLIASAWGTLPAHASPDGAALPSEAPIPSCLDQSIKDELGQSLRPRGVQKRDFSKRNRVAITGRGGVFAADLMSSSYSYGGAVAYFLTEDLGLEVSFDVTPVAMDLDAPLADFFADDRFEETGNAYLALAGLLWSPIHAKMKIGDGIVHSDILFAVGAGRMFHDSVQGVTFDAGAILDLYTTGWLTIRFDLRDIIAVQEAVGETRLTNNLSATLGLVLWVPFW